MPTATAKLLQDLGDAWSHLKPLPSLDMNQFERWSVEAGQVLEVVSNLSTGPDPAHADVDLALLRLADQCRRLGDCGMSATLSQVAARRLHGRGDNLNAYRARRIEGVSLRVAGKREAAAACLGADYSHLEREFPDEPLTALVLSDYAACLDDVDRATGMYEESLRRLERTDSTLFEQRTGRNYELERHHRHISIAEALLRKLWAQDGAAAGCEARVRHHLHQASRSHLAPEELSNLGVLEAELALAAGRRERGLELLRALEQQAHENPAMGGVLAPTYQLLAKLEAKEGNCAHAIEYCRRALLASLHYGNRAHEPLAVDTFIQIMRDTHCVDETSADVDGLASVLIEMLEAKDWYTGRNHSQSVGSLSTRIGKTLRAQGIGSEDPASLNWLDLPTLHLGGQLHDVGKLAVPWSILNKINPLTQEEFDSVRGHAALGEQILTQLGLHRAARIAGQHHERCDGRGYPRGIQEISLMGAIVAVADAFEAMITANRRYRARMNRDEGVQELVRCSGTVFDPRVVQAMTAIFTRAAR